MTIKEIDFQLIEDKAESKVFRFTNSDGSVYDMTDSTAQCHLYLDPVTPTSFACTIDVVTGKVTVPFTAIHTDNTGTFEYIIEETKISTAVIPLVKGQAIVVPYTPFSETLGAYLNSELPANLVLTTDYINQRVMYWRRVLQSAFNIADADLNIEASWPTLVNALIAKLVVYDAMILAARGSFIQFMGGSYQSTADVSGGGAIKSVETGPARVEYYDAAASAKSAFSSSPGKQSMFEALLESTCGLANQLHVKLHMCSGNKVPIGPQYFQNPDWDYPTLDEIVDVPSQG